jgi:hypothetical protein
MGELWMIRPWVVEVPENPIPTINPTVNLKFKGDRLNMPLELTNVNCYINLAKLRKNVLSVVGIPVQHVMSLYNEGVL